MSYISENYNNIRLYRPGRLPAAPAYPLDSDNQPSISSKGVIPSVLSIFDEALHGLENHYEDTFPTHYNEDWEFAVHTSLTSWDGTCVRVKILSHPGTASSHPLFLARRRVISKLSVRLQCPAQNWFVNFTVEFHPFFSLEWEAYPTYTGAKPGDEDWFPKIVEHSVRMGPSVCATPEVTWLQSAGDERAIRNYALLQKLYRSRN